MRHRSLLALLLASLSATLWAQTPTTPEAALRGFVARWNAKDLPGAARLVVGGKPRANYAVLVRKPNQPWSKYTLTNLRVSRRGGSATATYTLAVASSAGAQPTRQESTSLTKRGTRWLIVPVRGPSVQPVSLLEKRAYLLTNPEMMMAIECISGARKLAAGCLHFASNHNDVLRLTPATVRTALRPYVRDDTLWRCPSGGAYSLNPALAGKPLVLIRHPSQTVLLYEGRGGKLDFRHSDRAVVACADGVVRLVSRQEAKGLRWKP